MDGRFCDLVGMATAVVADVFCPLVNQTFQLQDIPIYSSCKSQGRTRKREGVLHAEDLFRLGEDHTFNMSHGLILYSNQTIDLTDGYMLFPFFQSLLIYIVSYSCEKFYLYDQLPICIVGVYIVLAK